MHTTKKIRISILCPLAAFLLFLMLFQFLYKVDNKYTAGSPYGFNGQIHISEEDLNQNRPILLIDGWEFYPDVLLTPADFSSDCQPSDYIFIGQYPNYSFISNQHSPFGKATYRMLVNYSGEPLILALEIPEIFSNFKIWINQHEIEPDSMVMFMAEAQTEIVISAENYTHYYSGLTYPPALSTPNTLQKMLFIRMLFYSILCLIPLTLVLYAAASWFTKERSPRFLHFGLLCLFFSIHCSYPFIHQFKLTTTLWYAIEDMSWLAVLYEMIQLSTLEAGLNIYKRFYNRVQLISLIMCLLCGITVLFILPNIPELIKLYGSLLDGYKLLCWLYLIGCAVWGSYTKKDGSTLILTGGGILGAALAINIFDSNQFEPIYTGWQIEYAGFFLILIFWLLCIRYTKTLLSQNILLTQHLEAEVEQRTAELHAVLDERKAFFSDLAHNLKAPMASIHGFTQLILRGNLYVDDEIHEYINRISTANDELCQRMQSLSDLNAYDKIIEPYEAINIYELFRQIYFDNEPEATISGINFQVNAPKSSACIYAQRKKLLILFENLIYNALSFTSEDGRIQIDVALADNRMIVTVADTGSGISPEHLPHIFERFYIGRENKKEGSGLGLYIVSLIIEELGGTIQAASELNVGTTFTISLPIMQSNTED